MGIDLGMYRARIGLFNNYSASFWEDIQYSVDMARQAGYSDIIITGDMNSDFNTRDGHILLNFGNSNNMSALIKEPTRITPTSATVLDQFLVSDHLTITDISVGAPLETSDHCGNNVSIKIFKK